MNISVFLVFTGSIIGANSQYSTRVGVRVPRISIFPVEQNSTFPGRVYDYKPCGGPGRVLDYIVEGCASDSICKFPAEKFKHIEYDFVPSENIPQIGVRYDILCEGEHRTVMEQPIENSEVVAGQRYRISADGTSTKEYRGKRITFYYMVYRVADNNVETCSAAKYDIY